MGRLIILVEGLTLHNGSFLLACLDDLFVLVNGLEQFLDLALLLLDSHDSDLTLLEFLSLLVSLVNDESLAT